MRSAREVLLSLFQATKSFAQRIIGRRGIRDGEALAYILAFALAVVTVGGFIRFHIASLYRQEVAYWRARQSSVADDRAQRVSNWLKDGQADAELLSSHPLVRAALRAYSDVGRFPGRPAGGLSETTAALDEMARLYWYTGVYVLDRDTRVIAQSSHSVPLSPRLAEISRTVARTGTFRIDLLGDAPDKTLISFSAPVFPGPGTAEAVRATGQPPGVVLLVVDASQTLFPILTREGVPTRTGETLLVRPEGDYVVFFSPLRYVPAGSPYLRFLRSTAPLPARAALEGRETFVEYNDYRGVPVLAATRHIPLTDWGMVRKIDRAEALEDFRRIAVVEGLAAGLLVFLLGGLLMFLRLQGLTRARKQEEEKFRALLESAPDAMVIADREGRIALVNAPTERMFGFERKELVGQALGMLFPEWAQVQPGESVPWDFSKVVAQHAGRTIEMFGLRKDRKGFPVEVRLSPSEMVGGPVFSCGIRDITVRKRVEEQLATQARIAEIFLTVPDNEMYNEVLKVILEVMQSEHGFFGYIDHDGAVAVPSMTRHFWDKCQVADKVFTFPRGTWGDSSWAQAIREKKPIYSNEVSTKAPEGPMAVRRLVSLPILFQGEVVGLFQVANKKTDYTEADVRTLQSIAEHVAPILNARLQRGRAEETLRESEERYRSLVLATSQIVWSTDTQGQVAEPIPRWQEYTGQTTEEILEGGWAKALHPDDVEHAARAWSRAIAQKTFYVVEYRVRGRDGTYRHFEARGAPVLNPDGSVREWVEACTDITERKRAEEEVRKLNEQLEQRVAERTAQLQASNQELEAFTYSVSHDLRAPLRHIDGFSKLLSEEHAAALPPEAKEYVSIIRESVLQMGTLIDDLLNLARVGRKQLSMQVTGLNSLVKEAIEDLKRANPKRVIDWRIQTLPFVECDPALMKQVFANLLSNAVKFTRPRKPAVIEVGATHQDGRPVVFVRDNGVGFSMKYADKLFGVFQRLHRTEDFEGTGVGLATVQRIIHKHGGRVWAEAELDRGATFYFTLGSSDGSRLENRSDSRGNP
jgi:PAS domain S-box-containing protein